jgi:hypothetical protein
MSFEEDQSNHIDTILGIKEESDIVKSNVVEVLPELIDKDNDIKANINKLDNIISTGTKAYDDLADVCKSFNKDRSYEVLAKVMDSLTNVAKVKHEMLKDLYKKDDAKKPEGQNVNNFIFEGSFKDLIKNIPKTQTIILNSDTREEKKSDVRYELAVKIENEQKLDVFTDIQFTKEHKEKIVCLVFDNAEMMNKMKFSVIEKYGKIFL